MKKDIINLIYKEDTILIQENTQGLVFPEDSNFSPTYALLDSRFPLVETEDKIVYSYDADEDFVVMEGFSFQQMRGLREHYKEENYLLATRGLHLLNWHRNHQYCGVCGTKFTTTNSDRSRTCLQCNNQLFPQTSLAVITGIIKDGQLLLAHNANFPKGLNSLIAGFVELGETLEEAVEREIFEEVGLKVKNIKYFGSQPWPFPNSMMVGFIADYESGVINTDDIEIESADWYTPDEFPEIPHYYSIARKIIEEYKKRVE